MKNIIIATVAIGLLTLSAAAPAQAGRLKGFHLPTKGQTTETTSPGDAFSPDNATVGDPKAECLAKGGRPVRVAAEYDFTWSCKL